MVLHTTKHSCEKGKKYFKGFFYPKVKAALGNDNAATRGSSITFSTALTTFTVFAPEVGDWRITKTFDNEAAARGWVQSKLNVSKSTPGREIAASGAEQ